MHDDFLYSLSNIIIIVLILVPFVAFSQQNLDRDVIVVKAYAPTISEAYKISSLPKIDDTVFVHPVFDYKIFSKQFGTSYQPEQIYPAKLLSEPMPHLYGNYLRLGIGTQLDPLAELYVNSLWSRKNSWGIYAKHFSANGKTKVDGKIYYPWFSENKAKLSGKQFFTKSTLSGSIEFNSNKYFMYGYDPGIHSLSKEDIGSRIFTLFELNSSYLSNYITENKMNYLFGLDFYYFGNNFKERENGFSITANGNEKYKDFQIGIDSKISYFKQADETGLSTNQTFIEVNPYATRKGEEWEYTLGINTSTNINPDDNAKLHIYPNLKFTYIIVDKFLISYFGFNGKTGINNYRKLITENPYYSYYTPYNTLIDFKVTPYSLNCPPTNFKKILYGGLRGNVTQNLTYNIGLRFSEIEDLYFFEYKGSIVPGYFFILIDKVDRFDGFWELKYETKKLHLSLSGQVSSFSGTDSISKPSYMPDYEFNLAAKYNLKDKILLNSELIFTGERYAVDVDNKATKLNGIADFNLGVEYRYTKKVSAFFNLNNIFNQKYFIWNHYPCWGFNALLGVSYAF
jgi:hypothetical protein